MILVLRDDFFGAEPRGGGPAAGFAHAVMQVRAGQQRSDTGCHGGDIADGFEAVVRNPHGLHARPATVLVDLAKGFVSVVRIRYNGKVADEPLLRGARRSRGR